MRQPTFYPVDAAFQLRQSTHAYVTICTDTGQELGCVGRSYTVLQNDEAFRALEPLLDQGVVRLETGGVLRSGADIRMLGRFDTQRFGPVVRKVFADEVASPNVRLIDPEKVSDLRADTHTARWDIAILAISLADRGAGLLGGECRELRAR